jgi:hypothetical protein
LILDSEKSKSILGWSEKLNSKNAITWSIEWSKKESMGESAKALTMEQLSAFLAR